MDRLMRQFDVDVSVLGQFTGKYREGRATIDELLASL